MSRKRAALLITGSVAALVLLFIAAGLLVIRSAWFKEKVRARMITAIEEATGGRAEAGTYRFDWRRLRIEVEHFVLHGTEPAGKPPLFAADSIAAGLRVISFLRRDIHIDYLDVTHPQIYLIIYSDGRTNMPEPRVKRRGTPADTLLNLAIGRFHLSDGTFEVEARSKEPFDLSGRNLDAKFSYDLAGPRYGGELGIQPLDVRWNGQPDIPVNVHLSLALEHNRLAVTSAQLNTGNSTLQFSGALEDFTAPHGTFAYQATASLEDASRIFHLTGLRGGTVRLAGKAQRAGSADYSITGTMRASGVDFRQGEIGLRGFQINGQLRAGPQGARLSGIRMAGESRYAGSSIAVQGRLETASLLNRTLELRGISLDLLGGSFEGEAILENFSRFRLRGAIAGFDARRAVAVYNQRQALPWDSLISGTILAQGALPGRGPKPADLRLSADLNLAPAPEGPPVAGQITARYDAASEVLDVGSSRINLPHSSIEASGALGREMRVRLQTSDLNNFLPLLGERAAAVPVKIETGSLVFDGMVTGNTTNPRIAGHLHVPRFSYSGQTFDSFQGDVAASSSNLALANAVLTRGASRAQFRAAVGLHDWNIEENSPVAASGTLRNGSVEELLAAVGEKTLKASGTASASGLLAGTAGKPEASGDLEIVNGSVDSEPFEHLRLHLNYAGRTLQVSAGQVAAGAKQAQFSGSYEHAPADFTMGRMQLHFATSAMPLNQIQTLAKDRPGIEGSVQITASGAADIRHGTLRPTDLHADITARGLALSGQALGNAHLQAISAGGVLRTTLDADFANSRVQGRGEWRLGDNYNGGGTINFSRIDLARLRDWLAPAKSRQPSPFNGFAQGELRINGPALKPELMTAELRVTDFELGPRTVSGPEAAAPARGMPFVLRNSGPIVAVLAHREITITNARLTAPSTDLTVSGRILLQRDTSLDLHGNGRIDLAVLHDFDPNVSSSGAVLLDASVRGTPAAPQVDGRIEVQNAAFNYDDFPNGLSNANGTLAFSGDRLAIQRLTAETGGGKVQLSGFAGYSGGQAVFRLHADAQDVRVRYPQGVSTVADANLNLTGTAERSMIAGNIIVKRWGINLESDFASALAKSSEPVQTPSSRTGFLGGLSFDVQIQTAPDVQFESTLTQGLEADANLRLRGTATNPALQGRINITQGQVLFFGTKYTIDQGTISFYNPSKIEPVLDIDLETRARGIDITLTISGPLNKLNLTPRSDPPLQFNEIVALLATGRTPDQTQLSQSATAQPLQQAAGSALLGQVIANPVSGRLQRFFGISRLRIDPTLPGIEYNPQARVTLEQQVTQDITFTYITNVTSANPQIVSVEWAASKQWSVVAMREENGLVGLDFYYKKRFK